jgi:Transposase DDE domain
MQTKEGKALYAKRRSTVETVFGILKHVQEFRQFLPRGLDSVQSEWVLVCIGWNFEENACPEWMTSKTGQPCSITTQADFYSC